MIDEWGKGAKYWDKAYNPMVGCRKCSEGCANCYAESLAMRFPELQDSNGGFMPHPPKKNKNPPQNGVVFVGNMTDIFGEWNNPVQIINWLMKLNDGAENLVLTKRAERMAKMIGGIEPRRRCWWGITAENQERLEERLTALYCINGKRWISAEPLLGELDFYEAMVLNDEFSSPDMLPFDWVVVGAESGVNRRPCKLEWVRSIVKQCQRANVPVFVKQLDIDGKLVKDINLFPEDLQIRQVPWGVK